MTHGLTSRIGLCGPASPHAESILHSTRSEAKLLIRPGREPLQDVPNSFRQISTCRRSLRRLTRKYHCCQRAQHNGKLPSIPTREPRSARCLYGRCFPDMEEKRVIEHWKNEPNKGVEVIHQARAIMSCWPRLSKVFIEALKVPKYFVSASFLVLASYGLGSGALGVQTDGGWMSGPLGLPVPPENCRQRRENAKLLPKCLTVHILVSDRSIRKQHLGCSMTGR